MGVQVIADMGSCWKDGADEPLAQGWARAKRLAKAAKAAGADCLKGQLYTGAIYPDGSREAALLDAYALPPEWVPRLAEYCASVGLEWACTVYRPEDVAVINPHVPFFKVASFELRHTALLEAVAATGKPVLLSTGAADEAALREALGTLGLRPLVTVLHCVSAYPAPLEAMNLRVLASWSEASLFPYGLSDHTPPDHTTAAVMAVALGASVIETHLCAQHHDQNPDAGFARDPGELAAYVTAIRQAEAMLGDGRKRLMEGEWAWARFDPLTGKRGTQHDG